MHYTGPKNRLSRKLGVDLGLKTVPASLKLARRLNIPPGQHGPKGRKRRTAYGERLAEKQKLKFIYGVTEKQLGRYFEIAAKNKGATGESLLIALERRLDNVIFRLGFAPTRSASRQLVSHGHVVIDGQTVKSPAYRVKAGEVIAVDDKAQKMPVVIESLKNESHKVPSWLDRQALIGKINTNPQRSEIDTVVDEQLIVEHYSR